MVSVAYSADIFAIQKFGGVSRYFVELAKQLHYSGQIIPKFATLIHINEHLKESILSSGLYLPLSPSRIKGDKVIRFLNDCHSRSLTSKNNFEIRHETFYNGGVLSLNASKTVTTVHDLIREKFTPGWHGFRNKQTSLSRADAIICVSQTTSNDLGAFYQIDPKKVFVIPSGVSRVFKCDLQSIDKTRNINQLIYVGSRDGYKDFKTLVLAFSYSKFLQENMKVLVFGNPFNLSEKHFMKTLRVENNFRVVTGDDKALASAYQNSLAIIITSTYEGFGFTVLEAMMSGCIVISTRGGSLGEIAGGFDVPFESSEPRALAEAIKVVVSQGKDRFLLTNRAQSYAESFSWEKTALKTIDVYKSLVL
jgi:glycosyltransferase involved in cell wall biosynthesis